MNRSALEAALEPSAVVTLIPCVPAGRAGATAVICVADTTVKLTATPPKWTAVAPVKLVPVMVTLVPPRAEPELGLIDVMVGAVAVNRSALEAALEPSAVVTLIPCVPAGRAGATAVICVADTTVKLTATPPKWTAVAPVKLVPVMVTLVPPRAEPELGLIDVMVGAVAVNRSALEAALEPSAVVTLIPCVPAGRAGATAVICVADTTVKLTATPPKWTAVAPVKLVPVMVTLVPPRAEPELGLIDVMVGAVAVNRSALEAALEPSAVVTLIPCVPAGRAGATAVICVADTTVKLTATPPKWTAVAPVKLVPVMVTLVPPRAEPELGLIDVMVGAVAVNRSALEAALEPSAVVTLIPCVPAGRAGATAVICVADTTVKLTATPPKWTAVAPVKLVPVMVTLVPPRAEPELGLIDVMVGAVAVNRSALEAALEPSAVVTLIPCVPAGRAGATAVICVADTTVKLTATPPKWTAVAPVKLVPVMVTLVPPRAEPELGLIDVMVGAVAVNRSALEAALEPSAVVTLIPCVPAGRAGATAVICVADTTVKLTATPPKWTAVAPVKLVPVMVTLVPPRAEPEARADRRDGGGRSSEQIGVGGRGSSRRLW